MLAVHLGFHTSVGFLARSFLMPLVLAFGYYLMRGDRPWSLAAVTVASALFYPPALLLNGSIFGFWKLGELVHWMRLRRRGRRMQTEEQGAKLPVSPFKSWYVYLIGFGIALLIILSHAHRVETHPALGGYLTNTELMSLPEFGRGGRVDISGALPATGTRQMAHFFYNDAKTPFGHWFANLALVLVVVFTGLRFRKLGRLADRLRPGLRRTVLLCPERIPFAVPSEPLPCLSVAALGANALHVPTGGRLVIPP